MAKEEKKKERKVCDNCGEHEKDCNCKYKKYAKGSYGLSDRLGNDDDESDQTNSQMGGMDESLKAPNLDGISPEKRKKKLDAFKAQADEAKAREKDAEKKHSLYKERKTKGIRFYDAKGSGYIKGGKKNYD
jgi:hypothetical protein